MRNAAITLLSFAFGFFGVRMLGINANILPIDDCEKIKLNLTVLLIFVFVALVLLIIDEVKNHSR